MNFILRGLVALFVGGVPLVLFASESTCVKDPVISGDSCKNLAFSLDLSNCRKTKGRKNALVRCTTANDAEATIWTPNKIYKTQLKKSAAWGGATQWAVAGPIEEINRRSPAKELNEGPSNGLQQSKATSNAEVSEKQTAKVDEKEAIEVPNPLKNRRKSLDDSESRGADQSEAYALKIRADNSCLTIEFETENNQIISCHNLVNLKYSKRSCENSVLTEVGEVDALPSCEENNRIGLRFKTSDTSLYTVLSVQRETRGRRGTIVKYRVESTATDQSKLAKLLPAPVIKPLSGELPEEKPVAVKISGFVWTEIESAKNFGFDATATGLRSIATFDGSDPQSAQSISTVFSNLNLDLSKDRTTFSSILDFGEIQYGDSNSGGGKGTRSTSVFKVRNIFITHELYDWLSIRAGLITTISDSRAFIFNDHIATAQANYKTDLASGTIWYGNAAQARPGDTVSAPSTKDEYFGIQGSLTYFSKLKHSLFGLIRNVNNDTYVDSTGTSQSIYSSQYSWIGGTFDFDPSNSFSTQVTLIGNWVKSAAPSLADESSSAYLADFKVGTNLIESKLNLGIEFLTTPGAKNAADSAGNPISGKRKSFYSPAGVSYLLTIATSDGVDDAPGSSKRSVIAGLSQPEGLKIAVINLSYTPNKKVTGLIRVGRLYSSAESSANSMDMGIEYDGQFIYQLSPSTTFQADYALLAPGSYYTNRSNAELLAGKLKFSF